MHKLSSALALAGLVTVPALATAEDSPLTGNITLTTDYVFRGVSQTQGGPAIQGGFDYAHPSGLYVGTWASNVSWVSVVDMSGNPFKENNSMEIDLYAGYKGAAGDLGYDVGIITYYYPGDKVPGVKTPDTTEVYLGGSWKFLSLKYSHVVSQNFIGWYDYTNSKKTRGSYYIDLSGTYDLGNGWGILGHVGYQKVKNLDDASYTDWKLGVSKDVGFGTFTLAYTDTDAKKSMYTWTTSTSGSDTEKVADGRVFLSFSKSF